MGRTVHVSTLANLVENRRLDVIGRLIRDHDYLACVSDPGFRSDAYPDAAVSESDYDRWRSATDDLLGAIRELQARAREVGAHLELPLSGTLLWSLRYARRNRRLRANYDTHAAELRAEFHRVIAEYQQRTGDLTEFLEEEHRRKRQRIEEEQRRREEERERERERIRSRRAAALDAATGAQWAYEITDYSNARTFWIYLSTLDAILGAEGELTVTEVQEALRAEREHHPYTRVAWGNETGRALTDRYSSEAEGWQALTGELIDPHPHDPTRPRRSGKYYGPSSNYGGDGGGGYSGCSGGGYSGGFGGGFR
ncbi:hypothetical protein ACSVDM_11660 [Nocardia sp. JW2]